MTPAPTASRSTTTTVVATAMPRKEITWSARPREFDSRHLLQALCHWSDSFDDSRIISNIDALRRAVSKTHREPMAAFLRPLVSEHRCC